MNIIYLISRTKKSSGPINQAFYIITGLNKIPGVQATLVSIAPEINGNSWIERFKDAGIPVVQLNHPSWKFWKSIRVLKKYIKENHIDVVHSASYKSDFVNMFLRKYVKTISTQRCLPNEIVEGFPKLVKPPVEKLHLRIIKKMSVIVACSHFLQKVFINEYGIKAEAVQNGVDTDKFTPVTLEEKEKLRSKLNLSNDKMIFLVLGTFRPRKNVGTIIDAFRSINESNIELVIVGAGTQEIELKEKAKGDSRIIFTGVVSNAKDYLQASDILVSSSLAEGLPNTVLEAISCGLPCILSDIGPHFEILEGTGVAKFFNRNSSKELADIMTQALSWNINEMSKEARELAESRYSISRLASNYLEIYKNA